jgi:hypothetical protein
LRAPLIALYVGIVLGDRCAEAAVYGVLYCNVSLESLIILC